jgi:hypothetical protein
MMHQIPGSSIQRGPTGGGCHPAVSSALVTVFRGKFCNAILPNRKTTLFERNEVLYEIGGRDLTFSFFKLAS